MPQKRFTDEQIAFALRQAEAARVAAIQTRVPRHTATVTLSPPFKA